MKIVVCPDSYKGTFTAMEIALLMEKAIKDVAPEHQVVLMPLSDGGEGFVDVWNHVYGGTMIESDSLNADGEPLKSKALITEAGVGVIECSSSCGLSHSGLKHNILTSTSRGLGIDIRTLMEKGIKKIAIGLGGSATNDGGVGALYELGVRFTNHQGTDFIPSGGSLSQIRYIDINQTRELFNNIELTLFTDVTNPLTGIKGATQVFSKQKGASLEATKILETNMLQFETILSKMGVDPNRPGMGAAGGMPAGLSLLPNVMVSSGINVILETLDAASIMDDADLLITGEGRLDEQSFSGKVLSGLIDLQKGKKAKIISMPATASNIGVKLAIASNVGCFPLFPSGSVVVDDVAMVLKQLNEQLGKLL